MAVSFKGAHFLQDIIRMGVRWSVGKGVSPLQASGASQLAHGRDVYRSQRPVALLLPRRELTWPDDWILIETSAVLLYGS
jgi:hypothetical protein